MSKFGPRAALIALAACHGLGCPADRPRKPDDTASAQPAPAPPPEDASTGDAGSGDAGAIHHDPGTVPTAPKPPAAQQQAPTGVAPTLVRLATVPKSHKAAGAGSPSFVGKGRLVALTDARGVDLVDPAKGTGVSITTGVPISAMHMSADESLLAVADGAGRVTLWDLGKGALRRSWSLESPSVVAVSPDGRKVAAMGPALVVWDVATGAEVKRFDATDAYGGLAFAADGKEIVVSSMNVYVTAYDLGSGAKVGGGDAQTGATFATIVSPDGRWAAASAPDGHGLQVFDVHAWGPRQLVEVGSCQEHVSPQFPADGRHVFAFGGTHWVKAFETGTWKPYASYHARAGRVVRSASADMSHVVVTREDGAQAVVVRVETNTETPLEHLFTGDGTYDFSADATLVAGAAEGTARVWSTKTGAVVYEVVP